MDFLGNIKFFVCLIAGIIAGGPHFSLSSEFFPKNNSSSNTKQKNHVAADLVASEHWNGSITGDVTFSDNIIYFHQSDKVFFVDLQERVIRTLCTEPTYLIEKFISDGKYYAAYLTGKHIMSYILPVVYVGLISDLKKDGSFKSKITVQLSLSHNLLSFKFLSKGELLVTTLLEYILLKLEGNNVEHINTTQKHFLVPSGSSYANMIIMNSPPGSPTLVSSSLELFLFDSKNYPEEVKKVYSFTEKYPEAKGTGELPVLGESTLLDDQTILAKSGSRLILFEEIFSKNVQITYIDSINCGDGIFIKSEVISKLNTISVNETWAIVGDKYFIRIAKDKRGRNLVGKLVENPISGDTPYHISYVNGKVLLFYRNYFLVTEDLNTRQPYLPNYTTLPHKIIFKTVGYWDTGNTYGISIADINNNGNEEALLIDLLSENKLFLDIFPKEYDNNFALERGLSNREQNSEHPGFEYSLNIGVTSGDINEDGFADFIVSYLDGPNKILLNNGRGFFRDVTNDYNLNVNMWRCESVILADVNNDGFLDLFATSFLKSNRLFLNQNGKGFTDVTASSGLLSSGLSMTATFGDVNGDGYADLYVGNWSKPNQFYINNRDGTFSEITNSPVNLETERHKKTNSVILADVNNDGWLDLFVGNRGTGNKLFLNDGTGNFIDITLVSGLNQKHFTYGAAFGDFTNDGMLDLIVTDFNGIKIYKNTGLNENNIPLFRDLTFQLSDIHQSEQGYFTSVVTFDKNKNGTLDAYIGKFRGVDFILENQSKIRNSLTVSVEGSRSNKSGIGCKLTLLKENELIAFREINGGEGYASNSSKIQHFGLPDSTASYLLKVEFPASGVVQYHNVKSGMQLAVKEYSGLKAAFFSSTKTLNRLISKTETYLFAYKLIALILLCIIVIWMNNSFLHRITGIFLKPSLKIIYTTLIIFIILSVLIYLLQPDKLNAQMWVSGIRNIFVEDFIPVLLSLIFFSYLSYSSKSLKPEISSSLREVLIILQKFGHGEGLLMNLNRLGIFLSNTNKIIEHAEAKERYILAYNEFVSITHPELIYLAEGLIRIDPRDDKKSAFIKIGYSLRYEADKTYTYLLKLHRRILSDKNNIFYQTNERLKKLTLTSINNITGILNESHDQIRDYFSCDAVEMLRLTIQKYLSQDIKITCEIDPEAEREKVLFNRIEMYDVFNIIIQNSVQAVSIAGKSKKLIRIKVIKTDSSLSIILGDNGIGMKRESSFRTFEKAYTNKTSGSGFGLYYAKQCVRKYESKILLRSIYGLGTIIKLDLRII